MFFRFLRKNFIFKNFRSVFRLIIVFEILLCLIFPLYAFAEAIPVGQPVTSGGLWTVIEGSLWVSNRKTIKWKHAENERKEKSPNM